MAGESDKDQKTEEATSKRLDEARDEGQVALSQELIAALMLCAAILSLVMGGGRLANGVGTLVYDVTRSLPELGTASWTIPDMAVLVREVIMTPMKIVVISFVPVVAFGVLVGFAQVGFRITPDAVAPKPNKVDPIKGFGRLFSMRSVVRTGMALLKIIAIAVTMCVVAYNQVDDVIRMGSAELGPVMRGLGQVALRCTLSALAVIVLIALFDLIYQRFQHAKDMRMTKEEVREEHKTTDGDPHVKARVRQLQREASRNRMMSDVPKSTVVVTNPDHYAVALQYDRSNGNDGAAPRVIAKGADHLAQRIKQVARDAGVTLYENVPLARSLYAQVDVGQEIPEDLYSAVATVLSYVFNQEEGGKAA